MAVVYLERDGQQFGPFSIEEAQRYILEGRFGAQDLGWIDGMPEWLLVAQIPQLQAGAAPPAVRLTLPEANPTYYLTASLAITFPFNLVIGIPIYYQLAAWIAG